MIYDYKLSKKAYAKINLFLDVVGKRDNGYHDISSIMQTISIYDDISLTIAPGEGNTRIICDDSSLPTDENNILSKAVAKFKSYTNKEFTASFEVKKNIPVSAGLGGGSADGAAAIMLLNELTEADLSHEQLVKIASMVGADLPFLLYGGTAITEGIGEIITPIINNSSLYLVVAKKKSGVSTVWAYNELDKAYNDFKPNSYSPKQQKCISLTEGLSRNDNNLIVDNIFNIFEDTIGTVNKDVPELKKSMNDAGAIASMMSGSGPSVFGLFKCEEVANRCAALLNSKDTTAFSCKFVKSGENI